MQILALTLLEIGFFWLLLGIISSFLTIAALRPSGQTRKRGEMYEYNLLSFLGFFPLFAVAKSFIKNGREENTKEEDISSDSELVQVILIRRDLNMRRGKEIAQGAHAACAPLSQALSGRGPALTPAEMAWCRGSFKKVVLQVPGKETMLSVAKHCRDHGLRVEEIWDAGLTEFHGERTLTAISIGPDLQEKIRPYTSHLKLY